MGTGKVYNGRVRKNDDVVLIKRTGEKVNFRVTRIYVFEGIAKVEVEEADGDSYEYFTVANDPFVGQHLENEFTSAGFTRFMVERRPLVGDASDPKFFQSLVDEFAEIFEGLDESLGEEALSLIANAITELRRLPQLEGSSLQYTPSIARAWR